MKRISLAVLVALALPAAALAKEPVRVTVCGADGCNASKNGKDMLALAQGGGMTGGPPSAAAAGYRVHLTFRDGNREIQAFSVWHIPSLRLIRAEDGTWTKMTAAGLAALQLLAGDLQPFPASAVPLSGAGPRRDALAPRTYLEGRQPPQRPAQDDSGTPWWLIAGLAATLPACGAFAFARFRRPHTA